MSWSGSCDIPPHAEPGDVDTALAAMVINAGQELTDETRAAVSAAQQTAKQLLYSGAFGPLPFAAGTGYHVTLSGHANPEHRPLQGWSNDSVSVSVFQRIEEVK